MDERHRKHRREIRKNKVISWSLLGPKRQTEFYQVQRPNVTDTQKMLKLATEEISLSVKESMPWFKS